MIRSSTAGGWPAVRPGSWPTCCSAPRSCSASPLWTGLGVCGGYLTAALSLSYYARRRIGPARWRKAHRLIPVAWALASLHVLGAGTAAGSLWLQVPLALSVAAIAVLLAGRLLRGRPRRRPSSLRIAEPYP